MRGLSRRHWPMFAAVHLWMILSGCGGGSGAGGSTPTYTIGGTLSGLNGTVVLQDNGGGDLTLTTNGSFTFATRLASGAAYNVTVLTQPTGASCTVTQGAGTVAGANVVSVAIACTPNLVSIAVTPQGVPLQPPQTRQFTATGTYTDGNSRDVTSTAQWTSSDASVATVSATGLVGAATAGHSTITATLGQATATGAVIVTPVCGTGTGTMTLGASEEHLLQLGQFGTQFTPDEHLTYARQPDGSVRLWIAGGTTAGGGQAIGFVSNDLATLTPSVSAGGNAQALLGPSGPGTQAFDADYVGPGAVIRAANGTDLLMFYHAENHAFGGVDYQTVPFYASIGLARSSDNGVTWTRVGQVITGMTPKPAAATPSNGGFGAANPSVIVAGGFIYLYYVDLGGNGNYAEVIHVARAPLSSDGTPGSWQKFHSGSFSQPGLGGLSTAVQGQVPPGISTISAGSPDISYSTYLQKYVLFFDTNVGWYYSTSTDLVTWTLGPQVFAFPSPLDNRQTGDTWYTYATLVSPEADNEQTTTCAGYLYYAKGVANVTAHTMYRRPFTFQ